MARLGHTSWRAALRYRHATAERDRKVANFLDEQIANGERGGEAALVGLTDATRGAGVGLAAGQAKRRRTKKRPDQQERSGGGDRNRTGVQGFAGPCLTLRTSWSQAVYRCGGERLGSGIAARSGFRWVVTVRRAR
jgi:hypothetical protein